MRTLFTFCFLILALNARPAVCHFHNYSGTNAVLTASGVSWNLPSGDSIFGFDSQSSNLLFAAGLTLDEVTDWDVFLNTAAGLSASRLYPVQLYYPQTGVEPFQLFVLGVLLITCVSYLLRSLL